MVDRALAWDESVLFRDCRNALKLTQTELAEELWVGLRSIQHWELGDRAVPGPVWRALHLLFILHKVHGVTTLHLLRRMEKMGVARGKPSKNGRK